MADWYALQGSAPVLLRHLYHGPRPHAGDRRGRLRLRRGSRPGRHAIRTRCKQDRPRSAAAAAPRRLGRQHEQQLRSAAYGYGTAITAALPSIQAMDQLGIAQYLTRLGLLLDEPAALDAAKTAWLEAPMWQALRHYVEDMLVAAGLVRAVRRPEPGAGRPALSAGVRAHRRRPDGRRPDRGVDADRASRPSGTPRRSKWVDAVDQDRRRRVGREQGRWSSGWTKAWRDRAITALTPVAATGAGRRRPTSVMDEVVEQFNARAAKARPHPVRSTAMSNVFIAFQTNEETRAHHRGDPGRQPERRRQRAAGHGQDRRRRTA